MLAKLPGMPKADESAPGGVNRGPARAIGTAATLLAAARSVVAERGDGEEAAVELLGTHAFEYYGEGLRQYMALRIGESEAKPLLVALRERFAQLSPEDALSPPGARARLYALARGLSTAPSKPAGTLKWRAPRRTMTGRSGIERIREGALGDESELLELSFARGLSKPELAFVLEVTEEEITERLTQAVARARQVLDTGAVDPSLPTALIEAFALESEERLERATPVDEEALPSGTRLGSRYVVDAHIGAGAFADVYRAHDTEVEGHVVALKLLRRPSRSEAARERALRELHLIASVFHPSIVHFNDNGWYEERLWFAMPWYEGESLEARMARAPLTREEAKNIFVPLARALAAMHASGIRHQDVKPDNIFLARLGGVGHGGQDDVLPVLLDLGVAAKDAELLLAGTPTYFAPEVAAQFAQMENSSIIGPKADVFSLALALRNALEPTTADDVVAGSLDRFIETRAVEAPPPPTGKELRFLRPHLARWLSADPEERPNATELAEQLSVLTAPEERRARTVRLLRIVLPLLVAITSVFLVVGWKLSERAQAEQLLATKARAEATDAQANLQQESTRRQELEAAIARARQRVESGQLSTDELTQELVKTEGQLEVTQSQVESLQRRTHTLSTQLTAAQSQSAELSQNLTRAQAAGSQARNEANSLQTQLQASQAEVQRRASDLAQSRQELAQAQSEARDASGQLATLTTQLTQARAEARTATAERDRLSSELEAERQRAAELTRQLAQARSASTPRAPVYSPPGVNVSPPTPTTTTQQPVPITDPTTPPSNMRPGVRVRVGR